MRFWDPAGFTADGSVEDFKRRRQTELKHGRISMLATMGYITPEPLACKHLICFNFNVQRQVRYDQQHWKMIRVGFVWIVMHDVSFSCMLVVWTTAASDHVSVLTDAFALNDSAAFMSCHVVSCLTSWSIWWTQDHWKVAGIPFSISRPEVCRCA